MVERLRVWAGPALPVLQAVAAVRGRHRDPRAGPAGPREPRRRTCCRPSHPLRLVTLAVLCGAELLRQRAPGVALTIGLVVAGRRADLRRDARRPSSCSPTCCSPRRCTGRGAPARLVVWGVGRGRARAGGHVDHVRTRLPGRRGQDHPGVQHPADPRVVGDERAPAPRGGRGGTGAGRPGRADRRAGPQRGGAGRAGADGTRPARRDRRAPVGDRDPVRGRAVHGGR